MTAAATFISSATTLGALLGGLCPGILSDWIGRKPVVGIADVIFIAGAFGQAVSHDVWSMIGGRFVIGVGVGLASSIAPLYIQELSPTRQRGRMVVLKCRDPDAGAADALQAWGTRRIDAGFANVSGGWRWMVGLGAVPAGIQLFLLYFLPESPRILIRRGFLDATYDVMAKIYPYAKPHEVDLKVKVLQAAVQHSLDISNSTTFFQR
ncbi:MFS general substrate transporter, partial [Schizophyllum commune Loenen D]